MKVKLNNFVGGGNLIHDPETRQAGEYLICNFTVAISAGYGKREQTFWCHCEAWQKTAEFCQAQLRRGVCVIIIGELITDEWEDKRGEKKSRTKLKVSNVQKLDGWDDKPRRQERDEPPPPKTVQHDPDVDFDNEYDEELGF